MIFGGYCHKMIVYNMSNILMIVGLPGSGKTTLAKQINADNGGKYYLIDDPKNFETDVMPFLDRDVIITDPYLCFKNFRVAAIKRIESVKPGVKIDWIFFENNPEKCLDNAKNRPNKKVESFIKNFSSKYDIPKNVTVVEV